MYTFRKTTKRGSASQNYSKPSKKSKSLLEDKGIVNRLHDAPILNEVLPLSRIGHNFISSGARRDNNNYFQDTSSLPSLNPNMMDSAKISSQLPEGYKSDNEEKTSLSQMGNLIYNALHVAWGDVRDIQPTWHQQNLAIDVKTNYFNGYKSRLTHIDRKPYVENEVKFDDLFGNEKIVRLAERSEVNFSNVEDVDQDEVKVINTAEGHNKIGTIGLRTCIAICGYGKTKRDELILGLNHYSGLFEPDIALEEIDDEMRTFGAMNIEYYLVGGMMTPGGYETLAMETESKFLALKDKYNILGVRLHLSEGSEVETSDSDSDSDSDSKESYDVVMTPEKIFFRKKSMYD